MYPCQNTLAGNERHYWSFVYNTLICFANVSHLLETISGKKVTVWTPTLFFNFQKIPSLSFSLLFVHLQGTVLHDWHGNLNRINTCSCRVQLRYIQRRPTLFPSFLFLSRSDQKWPRGVWQSWATANGKYCLLRALLRGNSIAIYEWEQTFEMRTRQRATFARLPRTFALSVMYN